MKVHMNYAGAGIMHAATLRAIKNILHYEKKIGSYETELLFRKEINHDVYHNAGKLIKCKSDNLALFTSATDAWLSVVNSIPIRKNSEIWFSESEYAANVIFFILLSKRHHIKLTVIPSKPDRTVDLDWMKKHLSNDIMLISITHMPSCCGIINPVDDIAELVQGKDTFFIIDACQSFSLIPLNMSKLNCDLLTVAARKFLCGPRGSAIAYISERLLSARELWFSDLHTARTDGLTVQLFDKSAKSYERAERNLSAIYGLNSALQIKLKNNTYHHDKFHFFHEEISKLTNINVLFPEAKLTGILAFQFKHHNARESVDKLREKGINLWAGTAKHTPFLSSALQGEYFIRASFTDDLTDKQLNYVISTLKDTG